MCLCAFGHSASSARNLLRSPYNLQRQKSVAVTLALQLEYTCDFDKGPLHSLAP